MTSPLGVCGVVEVVGRFLLLGFDMVGLWFSGFGILSFGLSHGAQSSARLHRLTVQPIQRIKPEILKPKTETIQPASLQVLM